MREKVRGGCVLSEERMNYPSWEYSKVEEEIWRRTSSRSHKHGYYTPKRTVFSLFGSFSSLFSRAKPISLSPLLTVDPVNITDC